MNLLLLPAASDRHLLSVDDPRLEHARNVLRLKVGDSFDVGAVNGPRGKGRVEAITAAGIELSLTWGHVPPLPAPVELLIGMPRPNTARKILQEATTLGVRRIIWTGTAKTDPAYARASLWTSDEWQDHVRLGAEQAFTTHLPEVVVTESLEAALELLPTGGTRWALDNYEATGAMATARPEIEPFVLALGPERGWGAADRCALREKGFALVHLGERVLRLETATVAGLTLLLSKIGQLG